MARRSQKEHVREVIEQAEHQRFMAAIDRRWLAVFLIGQAMVVVALIYIVVNKQSASDVRTIVRQNACRDLDRGPAVRPSAGCRDQARLIVRECRERKDLCGIMVKVTPSDSRDIIWTEVTRQLRRSERSARSGSGTNHRGSTSSGGTTSTPTSPPATGGGGQAPTGQPSAPTPPGQPVEHTPTHTDPSQPTPGSVVDDVLSDPVDALTHPVDTVNETACSVGIGCDGGLLSSP